MWLAVLMTVLAGYLLGNLNGAVCMSVLLGNDDIRNHGSGNAGLTNFLRRYGPSSGILVVLIDVVKTLVACYVGKLLLQPYGHEIEGLMVGALAVSLGHDYPALLGFHGGKGVLCGFAVTLAADWRCALLVIVVFALTLWITRYVSLSSILGTLAFVIAFPIMHWDTPFAAAIGVFIGLFIVFMHRSNLTRLFKGEEKKATFSQFRKKNKN